MAGAPAQSPIPGVAGTASAGSRHGCCTVSANDALRPRVELLGFPAWHLVSVALI